SQIYRTLTLSDNPGFGRDATIGVDLGAGLEIPMWRRKAYFGIQGTYRYFSFKDENSFLLGKDGAPTTVKPQGDSFDILAILGLNF
ncbi:MAG: hypothetical protein ACK5RO_03130, partial [Pseudobdellovibrionaceae bacterium]